ncbi:hypothetical protein NP522_19550 [Pseudomonas guariconensis]|uniref:hypothetical protein n=1 Tax=Pseudomonas guariconensis TaxID=1288410 RepID=UPI0023641E69|nr:hypothetical protein [Pseudomonas guariconensis]MDD2092384.1 hypothetical protein [Pseudomonas guariconensis]
MRASLLILLTASSVALAEQCDCQKIVGQCSGAIDFVKSYGSKPSYGAEIVVHSSEKMCSKVEYYLDNTPHQTVLVNRNQESESLFGTSPITEKSITYRSCKICSSTAPSKGPANAGQDKAASNFEGVWTGSGQNSFGFSQSFKLTITATGPNQYQVNSTLKNMMSSHQASGQGTSNGNSLQYQLRGGAVNCTLTLRSPNTASKSCGDSGGSSEAILTRE